MRTRTFAATAMAVASVGLVAAACSSTTTSGSSSASSAAPSPGGGYGGGNASAPASVGAGSAQVALRTTSLGTFLVDSKGRTLYLFEKDTSPTSTCTGTCAVAWPPFTTSGMPQAGSGVKASLLGTGKRSDGSTEVTYNGHPLYYFAADTSAGDAKGEGVNAFGAGWYVVNAAGNKINKS
jgi:predicted lipoprotein with Yx(FWY)xxD motif